MHVQRRNLQDCMRRESGASSLAAARTAERDGLIRELDALKMRLRVLDEQEELKRKIAKLEAQLIREKIETENARLDFMMCIS
jgi:hypothetical protein